MTGHHKQRNRVLPMRNTDEDKMLEQARTLFDRLLTGSYEGYSHVDHMVEAMWRNMQQSGYATRMLDRTNARSSEQIREIVDLMTTALLDKDAFETLEKLKNPETGKVYPDPGLVADEVVRLLDKSEKIRPATDPDAIAFRREAKKTAFLSAAMLFTRRADTSKQASSAHLQVLRHRADTCKARAAGFAPE